MDLAKFQLECLRSASVSVIFAVVRPQHVIDLGFCPKKLNRCMRSSTASLTSVVLISSRNFESWSRTRCHHTISQPNCPTCSGYGRRILGLRVLVLAQLGDLLPCSLTEFPSATC